MSKAKVCSLLIIGSFFAQSAATALETANRDANPRAKAILNYLANLSTQKERRIICGQFTDFGNGAGLRLLEQVHEKTGQWPALIGVDYADFPKGSLTFAAPNQAAIEYWKQGGLVTVSAHLFNPANTNGGGLRDKGVDLSTLLDPISATHARWVKELDVLAEGLLELKAAGVVVLWRPFHEMNGDWFWWGGKEPGSFIKIWRDMFDYFTRTKGLDNLLWVYSPNQGDKTAEYFAGEHYVDLVGLDAYTDSVDTNHIKGVAQVASLGKPFGFTEYGPHGPHNPPGDYDYLRFIQGVTNDFPQTVFFMSWNWKWSLARNNHTKELLNQPVIVCRDQLPAGLVDVPQRN